MGDIIFYIKSFVIFSFLGFLFESFIYKASASNRHSGALFGPYTLVYGTGFTLNLFIFRVLNLDINFFNILLYYFLFCFGATTCEFLFGHLINFIFHIDLWDYSSYKDNLGKYICIKYFFLWGLISFFIIFFGYNFLINFFNIVSDKFTLLIVLVMFVDFLVSLKKTF